MNHLKKISVFFISCFFISCSHSNQNSKRNLSSEIEAMKNNVTHVKRQRTILMPLPAKGFDPTEAGVSFKILKENGIQIVIATPEKNVAQVDNRMFRGDDLGLLKKFLMADKNGVAAFKDMMESPEFLNPIAYDEIKSSDYDGLLLPGGHDKGMRVYLESQKIQNTVTEFFNQKKPVGAICHGVVLLARSKYPNGDSVIKGKKVTALLRDQEMLAYYATKAFLGDYYRTYNQTVEDEVIANLRSKTDFQKGVQSWSKLKVAFLKRDSLDSLQNGFVVKDDKLVTARWPGDAHLFAMTFLDLLLQND